MNLKAVVGLLALLTIRAPLAQEYDASVLRASVSPEFFDGLHSKYLRYLAEKLDRKLILTPMPFARRVMALRQGELDIMVGLQRGHEQQDEFVYVQPPYERLRHTFFVRDGEQSRLSSFAQLKGMSVGVTIHAKYYEAFSQLPDLALVQVSSLAQKVALLQKGRIDTFIHYEQSTLPYLEEAGLSQDIVLAEYQPRESKDYFVAISQNSPIVQQLANITDVVVAGIAAGDFARIRNAHYRLR